MNYLKIRIVVVYICSWLFSKLLGMFLHVTGTLLNIYIDRIEQNNQTNAEREHNNHKNSYS